MARKRRKADATDTAMTEADWLAATDPVAMQAHVLKLGVTTRRVQLLVCACGDVIWDRMNPQAQTAFVALRHAAEGTATAAHKKRLRECGDLPDWLDWILGTGGRTAHVSEACVALVREVFGNPFRSLDFTPWRTDTAMTLARQMYEANEFSAMAILADALQDAGCDRDDVLTHCRDTDATHVRGCWVIDGVLGKV